MAIRLPDSGVGEGHRSRRASGIFLPGSSPFRDGLPAWFVAGPVPPVRP